MRAGLISVFALALLMGAYAAQASPLIPAGGLAGIEASGDVVPAHHRSWHKKKKTNRGLHLGWTRGKHKGWAKKYR